mgnify:CR=1 FL=1
MSLACVFVLQPAKRIGENNAVIVHFERTAGRVEVDTFGGAVALAVEEFFPDHCAKDNNLMGSCLNKSTVNL